MALAMLQRYDWIEGVHLRASSYLLVRTMHIRTGKWVSGPQLEGLESQYLIGFTHRSVLR